MRADAAATDSVEAVPAPRQAVLATTALVLGGVAIGTTEFVTMGLLPQIAEGVRVSIPTAGHAISAYAIGVVVGAPLIAVLGGGLPRKGLLLALTVVIVIGNVGSALAPGFGSLLAARFLAGVPHGAFFGVASLVAVELAAAGQSGRAVGRVMLGIPIANMLGVPGATWLGQQLGWRSAYWLVAAIAVATFALIALSVPRLGADDGHTVARELRAFANVQVALTLLVGAVGFGGMFAMFSYIAPTLTEVTGLSSGAVPLYLFLFGLGGFVGSIIAGRLGDWSVLRGLAIGCLGMGANLAVFALVARWAVPAAICIFASSVLASILVVNLQLRLMDVAGAAQTLGAASNHAALNLANALGAWLGGVVIARGLGYTAPSWVGAALSAAGVGVLAVSVLRHRRTLAGPRTH